MQKGECLCRSLPLRERKGRILTLFRARRRVATCGSVQNIMRIPILDGYRAASIIFVLCGHLLPIGPKAWRLNEAVAALGMTMFFSLSGFLIASQLLKDQHIGRFLVRRAARILPLAFAYCAVAFLILSCNPAAMLFSSLFLINYLHSWLGGLNGHLWSLCVEVHFYIAIAAVVAIGGRKSVWIVWPALVAVTATRVLTSTPISIETHLRVDEILSGACLATCYHAWSQLRRAHWMMAFVALLAVLAASSPLVPALPYARPYLTALLFVAVANQGETWLRACFTSWPARYLAEVSYALYVIHPATTIGWLSGSGTFDKYVIKRPISIALTFTLAHFSTFHYERWWQRKSKTLLPNDRLPDQSALARV